MFIQTALIAAQMVLGEVLRPRPKRVGFGEFVENNKPDELRPVPYGAGTFRVAPQRIWYGDYRQRAVERDSHWSDYVFIGPLGALFDFITVGYRYYVGEAFALCYGPDTHVEQVLIAERLMYQTAQLTDNAGGGFLIDDPQAWGGDQPPGEGGQYSWCDITRGNYTDPTNAYLESLLTEAPNRTPSLRGVSTLISRGPSGFTESGYFAAGGIGFIPRFKTWEVTCRRQPNNLLTGFHQVGGTGKLNRRHANPAEVIYEWATSIEYGARLPLDELNVASLQAAAETFYDEDNGWSGKIETPTQPIEVINNICAQVDAVFDPSPSLGFTLRLIRRTYSIGSLRVLNPSIITTVENFTPGTYDDTVNKVEVPCIDQDNNFTERKGMYIDAANQIIQDGRIVPQVQDYLGVGDLPTANAHATRDGQAVSVPRAAMTCEVLPTFGRDSYRSEPVLLQWESPTFTKVMRTMEVTPGGPERGDYRLRLVEDPFATGFRTSADPGETGHVDPGAGLATAPPSAEWNEAEFAPDGLTFTLQTTNTNQFLATITGGITFDTYAPGGQYARVYVTEPGGVQTLSPLRLLPDGSNEATFQWPAIAAGVYEFCVQTYSLRDATNGVKVCASITVAELGSPSASPSSSVSPSVSPSLSPSSSISASPSPSSSPSASISPSSSVSPSPSASVSPSSSVSPSVSPSSSSSASQSPSSSQSPSASVSPSSSASSSQSPSSSVSPSVSPSSSASSSASPSVSPSSSASPSASPGLVGQALVYNGTGSAQSISGADFSPDLAILRRRNANGGSLASTNWEWIDNVRGLDKTIRSNTSSSEVTDATIVTSFDANGFTLGTSNRGNLSGGDFLALLLQVTASAFDIVTYTGTGVAHTIAHGLGVVPELIIVKNRTTGARSWEVYSAALGNTKRIELNGTSGASTDGTTWNNTSPTSSVFTVGSSADVNQNTNAHVAYLFASLNPGVKVGSYTGDGNTNGPTVNTGFEPRFVIIKRTDAAGNWYIFDNQRDPSSPHNTYQSLNLGNTDADVVTTNTAGGVDFLSTGFQSIDSAPADINVNGATYIYLALA